MTDRSPKPSDMLASILREQVEIKARMAVLDATVQAQGQMISALIVSLPVSKRPHAFALMRAQCGSLDADGEENAAHMLRVLADAVEALLGEDGGRTLEQVTATLSLTNELVKAAPRSGSSDAILAGDCNGRRDRSRDAYAAAGPACSAFEAKRAASC